MAQATPTPLDDVLAYRREVVGRYRKMGYTVREIAALLPNENPPITHPDGKPYSYQAVYQDVLVLREEWKRDAAADFAGHVADQVEQIRLAQHNAWLKGDLSTVLAASDRLAKLMGLNAPDKVEQTTGPRTIVREIIHITPDSQEGTP